MTVSTTSCSRLTWDGFLVRRCSPGERSQRMALEFARDLLDGLRRDSVAMEALRRLAAREVDGLQLWRLSDHEVLEILARGLSDGRLVLESGVLEEGGGTGGSSGEGPEKSTSTAGEMSKSAIVRKVTKTTTRQTVPRAEPATLSPDNIRKQIAGAGWNKDDNVARDIVGKLASRDIKALPVSVRNLLYSALTSGIITNSDENALKKLYSVRAIDPAFKKVDDLRRARVRAALAADATLQDAKADWSSLSDTDRIAVLTRISDLQSDIYGMPRTRLHTYSQPPSEGRITYGGYNSWTRKMSLNTDDAAMGDFDEAVDTVTHENAHRFQQVLTEKLAKGTLKPPNPEYEQARTFSFNAEYYVVPGDDPYVYSTQPVENHAFDTGRGLASSIP